jgi:hypothetical protein
MCIIHDFCTEPINVRYAGPNGLSANASPLLSLTQRGHSDSARGPTLNAGIVPVAAFCMVLYETRLMPGGCQVPSPGGRIEGGSVFGQ